MLKIFLILVIELMTMQSFCQKKCSGIIFNSTTQNPIPYATIALLKENTGVNADENGYFKIISSNPKKDSLRISSVGYKTLTISVINFDDSIVNLDQLIDTLSEVVISTKFKNEAVVLGGFKHCLNHWLSGAFGAVPQLAKHFTAPEAGMLLNEISICKRPTSSLFRIRIYSYDSLTGNPGYDLADSVIQVDSDENSITINLDNYHIVIPQRDFFIALEWLYLERNAFPYKVKSKEKKWINYAYGPEISFKINDSQESNFFILCYNGKWREPFQHEKNRDFLISTKLKFRL